MIDDPHSVLGVPKNTTQDEIKKAYRRKAKEYHPDLHPNDPEALRKMNEANEAYDMLMNPEKYEAKRAQHQQRQQARNQYSGGYYGQQGSQGNYNPGGGYSDSWGDDFSFEDLFGFGYRNTQSAARPQPQPGDSVVFQQAIAAINSSRFEVALNILTSVPSSGRNARWYYLASIVNHRLGNTVLATEQIQKSVQMEPNNNLYHQLLQQYRYAGQTYERNAQGFDMQAMNIRKICFGLCLAQMCCPYCI